MAQEYACDNCGAEMSKSGYYTAKKRGYCRKCKDSSKENKEEFGGVISFSSDELASGSSDSPEPSTLFTVGEVPDENPQEAESDDDSPSWRDFNIDENDSTENIPNALKMASAMTGGGGGSNVDLQLMHETNLQLLKMTLTGVDWAITRYGQVATMNEEYVCKHSETDKQLVASAQYRYMMEKGLNPSDYVSSGGIALALTGSYILPPIMKIQKKKKREVFGNFIKSIPKKFNIIGRFRRRRRQRDEQN